MEGRDFTPIENKIIEKVVHIALVNLMEAWEDVHPIKTDFIRSESNPLVVNVIPPDDYLITVKFEVELTKSLGSITICIPYSALQPIRHKLAGGYQQDNDPHLDQFWIDSIRSQLNETELDVSVDLGRSRLSIRDLLNLKSGDIIILDNDFRKALTAKVEGVPKYEGYVGSSRGKKAFKIEQTIHPPH